MSLAQMTVFEYAQSVADAKGWRLFVTSLDNPGAIRLNAAERTIDVDIRAHWITLERNTDGGSLLWGHQVTR